MRKIKHEKRKSDIILIINIISLILLVAFIFYLNYDFKNLQEEWKKHVENREIYIGNGEWFPTRPIININDTEPPSSSLTYEFVNDPFSGLQININES